MEFRVSLDGAEAGSFIIEPKESACVLYNRLLDHSAYSETLMKFQKKVEKRMKKEESERRNEELCDKLYVMSLLTLIISAIIVSIGLAGIEEEIIPLPIIGISFFLGIISFIIKTYLDD